MTNGCLGLGLPYGKRKPETVCTRVETRVCVGEFKPPYPLDPSLLGCDLPGLCDKEKVKQAIWRMKPKKAAEWME